MKYNTKARQEFNTIQKQYPVIRQQASTTKNKSLWHLEAVIRNKIKSLRVLPSDSLPDYRRVYDGDVELFENVSVRLLAHYNQSNRTDYRFDDIIQGNYKAWLNAGILSVLMTRHIPKLVAEEYNRLLPANPKDEYPEARKMKRKFFLHLGETNTGKTYNALQRLKNGSNGVYLAPLRILALENFERLNNENVPCNLLTGKKKFSSKALPMPAAPSKRPMFASRMKSPSSTRRRCLPIPSAATRGQGPFSAFAAPKSIFAGRSMSRNNSLK